MVRREAETPPREVPVVRIFVSSPGDVAEERTLARQFIDSELPKFPHFREKVTFELIAWDDPAARIPMLATETPQDSMTAARPRPANCDIVIVILWSRMGTPLPDSVRKPNGEPYLSGTEWEYEDAVNSPQQPPPQVLVYRRTEEPKIGLRDPQKKEKEEQFERIEAFFAQFHHTDGSLKGGVNEYATPSDFKVLLYDHLNEMLYQRLQPSAAPPISANRLLASLWDLLAPDLQDAFALAATAARREGKDIISTRTLFAALRRLHPGELSDFFDQIPAAAMPEPISDMVPMRKGDLAEIRQLSSCIRDSLSGLAPHITKDHKLMSEDIFVDIARHGSGSSVIRLRTHGVSVERVNQIVKQLGWSVAERI